MLRLWLSGGKRTSKEATTGDGVYNRAGAIKKKIGASASLLAASHPKLRKENLAMLESAGLWVDKW